MEGAKFLFILGISVLCFGVYTIGASRNITEVMNGTPSKVTGASLKALNGDPEINISPHGDLGGFPYCFRSVRDITVSVSEDGLQGITFTDVYGRSMTFGCGFRNQILKNATINIIENPLTGISGEIGNLYGYRVVKTITFHTKDTNHGPYGTAGDTPFSFHQTGGIVSGFHGIYGWLLVSIGVHVEGPGNYKAFES